MKNKQNNYENNIVRKPWGYEYLVYENEYIAIWFLNIKYTHSTSLHSHPNKTTGLFVLDGNVEVSFFNNSTNLNPLQKIMIRKGLFHSTKSVSENGSLILEIETPSNKKDLVRFRDNYGREGKPYEDENWELPKSSECLWIDETETIYNFANSILKVKKIVDISELLEISDSENIIFLRGGIKTDYSQNVAGPGDIVSFSVIKQLSEVFKNVDPETIIMTVKKNG